MTAHVSPLTRRPTEPRPAPQLPALVPYTALCGVELLGLSAAHRNADGTRDGTIDLTFVDRFTGDLCPDCAAVVYGQLALDVEVATS